MRPILLALLLVPPFVPAAWSAETIRRPDEATANSLLMKYLRSPQGAKIMYDMGVVWDRDRNAACPDGRHTVFPEYVSEVFQPVEIKDGADKPSSGAWSVRFRMERCSRSVFYRILLQVKPDGSMDARRLVVGETQADFQLIRDLAQSVRVGAAVAAGNMECRSFVMLDSYPPQVVARNLPGYQGQTGDHRRERWWLNVCGTVVAVDVNMFPNPKLPGTSFSIDGNAKIRDGYVLR
jgi:hypothetical protein